MLVEIMLKALYIMRDLSHTYVLGCEFKYEVKRFL